MSPKQIFITMLLFFLLVLSYAQGLNIFSYYYNNSLVSNESININCIGNMSGSCVNNATGLYLDSANAPGPQGIQGIPGQNGTIVPNSSCGSGNVLGSYSNVSGWTCSSLNLSNISVITGSGGIVSTNLPDGSSNITNITVSGGLNATWN